MSEAPGGGQPFVASVIIPAHNEEFTIARTLTGLLSVKGLDVIVICNGCSDRTADIARDFGPAVRVLEIPDGSKNAAVKLGNESTSVFPRLHLDADVQLDGLSLHHLLEPIGQGLLATAPGRHIARDGCGRIVNAYYDVWEQLPQVKTGLFGRGAFVLSEEGQRRVSSLPSLMSDDLAASDAFAESERAIVTAATVTVWPARTTKALIARRVRVVTGNAQAARAGVRREGSSTGISTLLGLGRQHPRLLPRLPVFLGVTLVARWKARKAIGSGDFTTWQRDDSSRAS